MKAELSRRLARASQAMSKADAALVARASTTADAFDALPKKVQTIVERAERRIKTS